MEEDRTLSESLQHPRRSLGNRYRSQAEKFLKLGNDAGNLSWAEQSAKQVSYMTSRMKKTGGF